MNVFSKSQGKMKKILEKSGKSQGILSEEKSGNPAVSSLYTTRKADDTGNRRNRIQYFDFISLKKI